MPFIDGTDLRSAASGHEVDAVLGMFIEIVGALAYAHDLNVLHQDLKPTNVRVRKSDGQPIILDCGSAYLLDFIDSLSLTSQVVGTIKNSTVFSTRSSRMRLRERPNERHQQRSSTINSLKLERVFG
jgi:serine/threonine protein kinase